MKLKHILFISTVIISLNSCELDRLPKGQISSSNFWLTQSDAEKALMGCYAYLDVSVYDAYLDGYADNSFCQYPWESNATIISAGSINTDMDDAYEFVGIRRFNYFLDNVNKVTMSEALKKQYIAEVRVLRAWRYFKMANKFGPVPLFTTSITDAEEAKVVPKSENEVISFALTEIEQSVPDLSQDLAKSRITKGAALSLKARMELISGQWAKAAATAQQVMGMGYELFNKDVTNADVAGDDDYSKFITFANDADKMTFYKGLYSYEQLFWDANKENSEVILNSESIQDDDYYNYISLYLLPDNVGGGWASITPTVELVNAYWKRNGTAFTPPTKEARAAAYNNGDFSDEYLKEFKDRDTRLYATILFPGSMWHAFGVDNFTWNKGASNISKTGYNYRKMVDPNFDIWQNKVDYPLIRYAEILLTYAEAKNEASGPDASVYDALDKIRTRAGMPKIDRTANNTKETLRETIRNERRIELAGEGFRWYDTRRWNIAKSVMVNTYAIDGDLAQERKWNDSYLRLPYPQAAIDRNPNLKDAQTAKGY